MSEFLEDLAKDIYGTEGAKRFFQAAPLPWSELAKTLETESPCISAWEFSQRYKYLRELTVLHGRLVEAGDNEKAAEISNYTDALGKYLSRSLHEYEFSNEEIH